MTSCPSEEELVLFVEDELPAEAADDVADHLVACAACRRLVARSEAALRYALGGAADRERVATVAAAVESRTPARMPARFAMRRRAAIAGLVTAAAAAAVLVIVRTPRDDGTVARVGTSAVVDPRHPPTLCDEVDGLLARMDRLAAPPSEDGSSDVALAALAAAEARLDLGMATGEARLRDVVERFPGTPESREARARLASLGGGR